jgi:hypothetical protein
MKLRSMPIVLGAVFLAVMSGPVPAPQMPDAVGQAPDLAGCMNNPDCNNSLLALHAVVALQTQAIQDLRIQLMRLEIRIKVLEAGETHAQ